MLLLMSMAVPDNKQVKSWIQTHIDENLFLSGDNIIFEDDTNLDADRIAKASWGAYRSFLSSSADKMEALMKMAEDEIGTRDIICIHIGYMLFKEKEEEVDNPKEDLCTWVDNEPLDIEREFSYYVTVIPKANDRFLSSPPAWFVGVVEDILYFRETVVIPEKIPGIREIGSNELLSVNPTREVA